MQKVLNSYLSKILVTYFRHLYLPSKFRLWDWIRTITGYPRLSISLDNGAKITLDERNWHERVILSTGRLHEPEVWNIIQDALRKNEVFWDIGANIGSYSALISGQESVDSIYAFEPNPSTYEVLSYHLELNEKHLVSAKAFNVAVGDDVGSTTIYLNPKAHSSVSTSACHDYGGESVLVEQVTGDSIVARGLAVSPTIMKIDVEGYECEVLKGCEEIFSQTPPKLIMFETKCDYEFQILNQSIPNLLHTYGYTIKHLKRSSGKINTYFKSPKTVLVENFLAYTGVDR